MRAPASLTRSGIIEYRARELNIKDGDPDRVVRLFRKPEHVFNDTTKESIRGISLTVSHPEGVTPENWESTNVGNVVGETHRVGDMLMGEILIGSKRGIDMVEKKGWEELSIGYSFDFAKTDSSNVQYEYETTGPLIINHVAIVEKGRAGSKVRIHDRGRAKMTDTDIKQIVADAMKLRDEEEKRRSQDQDSIKKMVADTVAESLKTILPTVLADMPGMKKKKGDGDDEDDDKDGGNAGKPKRGPKLPWDGKGSKDEFVNSRISEIAGDADSETLTAAKAIAAKFAKDEMSRIATMKKVSSLLSDEDKQKMVTASTKDILVKALDGKIKDAESKTEDYLMGIVDMMGSADVTPPNTGNIHNFPTVDTGLARNPGGGKEIIGNDVYGPISGAYDEYANSLEDMWMDEDERKQQNGGR